MRDRAGKRINRKREEAPMGESTGMRDEQGGDAERNEKEKDATSDLESRAPGFSCFLAKNDTPSFYYSEYSNGRVLFKGDIVNTC